MILEIGEFVPYFPSIINSNLFDLSERGVREAMGVPVDYLLGFLFPAFSV